jgi:ATP-dependent Lhr-like helicase
VVLVDGTLAGYLNRQATSLQTFLPEQQPQRSQFADALSAVLIEQGRAAGAMLLEKIDGRPAGEAELAGCLERHGFARTSRGLLLRRHLQPSTPTPKNA